MVYRRQFKARALMGLIIGALLLPLLAVACGGDGAGSGSSGGGESLTVLITNLGNGRFDPLLADGEDLKQQRMMNTSLVGGGGGSVLTPAIAKSWELSSDAKTWTFTVNEGFIKFHHGDDLDAEDVLFSLNKNAGPLADQLLADAVYEPRDVADYNKVVDVRMGPNSDQVVIEWEDPRPDFAFFYSENAQGTAGMVISKDYFEDVGGVAGFEDEPDGTGPYRVTSFVPEQKFEFERFEDYFWHSGNGFDEDRRGKFELLTMEVVPEDATRVAALDSGTADLVEGNILMLDQIKANGGSIAWQNESAYNWIVMVDCWDPSMWCFDKRVRQAVEYAIDKKTIVDELYGQGATVKGWGYVTPNAMGYSSDLDPLPYDPDKAKRLLDDAGLDPSEVSFDIWTWEAGDTPLLPELAQLFHDAWEDLGFDVEVNVGDASAVRQQWNNRQLPGSVLVRTNEARFDGTSITAGGWTNPDIAWRAVSHPDDEPYASTSVPAARKALADININTRPDSFNEAYKVLKDENMYWSAFYTNLPWGVGPSIKEGSYKPWTLVPYVTAIWTAEPAN